MGKEKKVAAIDRLADTTQMISCHLVPELGLPKKSFSSRLRHCQQVGELANIVAVYLDADLEVIYLMALFHDFGQRVLSHQSEEFLKKKVEKHYINRAWRHELNVEYSLDLHQLRLPQVVVEAGRLHSGERKVFRLEPGKPVENAVISKELSFNRGKESRKIFDIAPQSIEACIIRICDPLCHIRDDYRTLMRLGEVEPRAIPTNEEIAKSFAKNSFLEPGKEVIAIEEGMFNEVVKLRERIEKWQKTEKVLKLRELEQELLERYWQIYEDKDFSPEQIVDRMNLITEEVFFGELEEAGIYKRK